MCYCCPAVDSYPSGTASQNENSLVRCLGHGVLSQQQKCNQDRNAAARSSVALSPWLKPQAELAPESLSTPQAPAIWSILEPNLHSEKGRVALKAHVCWLLGSLTPQSLVPKRHQPGAPPISVTSSQVQSETGDTIMAMHRYAIISCILKYWNYCWT